MLALDGQFLGLLCDDAKVLLNFTQQSFAIPNAMRTHDSPITGLIQYEQSLACLSDASHLFSYVKFTAIQEHEREQEEVHHV